MLQDVHIQYSRTYTQNREMKEELSGMEIAYAGEFRGGSYGVIEEAITLYRWCLVSCGIEH